MNNAFYLHTRCGRFWWQVRLSTALRLCDVFGKAKKFPGFVTLLFAVSVYVSGEYAWYDYWDTHSAFLMAIEGSHNLTAEFLCNAVACEFSNTNSSVALSSGQNWTINAEDPSWTIRVLVNNSFNERRSALVLLEGEEFEFISPIDQEALKFVMLSKTVDETYSPPLESWSIQVFSSFAYFPGCRNETLVCGALQINFDNKIYTISHNSRNSLVLIASAILISAVLFWRGIELTLACHRGSELLKKKFHTKTQ